MLLDLRLALYEPLKLRTSGSKRCKITSDEKDICSHTYLYMSVWLSGIITPKTKDHGCNISTFFSEWASTVGISLRIRCPLLSEVHTLVYTGTYYKPTRTHIPYTCT